MKSSVSARTLVPPKRSIIALSAVANLVFLFACTVVPISEASPSGYLGYGLFLGCATALFVAMATARVDARGGDIVIRNVLTDVTIPRACVARVDSLNGLRIVDNDGREHGVTAHGESLLQAMISSEPVDEGARKIETWLADPSLSPGSPRIRTSLRRWWFTGFPVLLVFAQLYELLLFALTPALRPLLVG